jgi:hypothetical protein
VISRAYELEPTLVCQNISLLIVYIQNSNTGYYNSKQKWCKMYICVNYFIIPAAQHIIYTDSNFVVVYLRTAVFCMMPKFDIFPFGVEQTCVTF